MLVNNIINFIEILAARSMSVTPTWGAPEGLFDKKQFNSLPIALHSVLRRTAMIGAPGTTVAPQTSKVKSLI